MFLGEGLVALDINIPAISLLPRGNSHYFFLLQLLLYRSVQTAVMTCVSVQTAIFALCVCAGSHYDLVFMHRQPLWPCVHEQTAIMMLCICADSHYAVVCLCRQLL